MSFERPNEAELLFRNKIQAELARRATGDGEDHAWYRKYTKSFSEVFDHVRAEMPDVMNEYERSPEKVLERIEEELYEVEPAR